MNAKLYKFDTMTKIEGNKLGENRVLFYFTNGSDYGMISVEHLDEWKTNESVLKLKTISHLMSAEGAVPVIMAVDKGISCSGDLIKSALDIVFRAQPDMGIQAALIIVEKGANPIDFAIIEEMVNSIRSVIVVTDGYDGYEYKNMLLKYLRACPNVVVINHQRFINIIDRGPAGLDLVTMIADGGFSDVVVRTIMEPRSAVNVSIYGLPAEHIGSACGNLRESFGYPTIDGICVKEILSDADTLPGPADAIILYCREGSGITPTDIVRVERVLHRDRNTMIIVVSDQEPEELNRSILIGLSHIAVDKHGVSTVAAAMEVICQKYGIKMDENCVSNKEDGVDGN